MNTDSIISAWRQWMSILKEYQFELLLKNGMDLTDSHNAAPCVYLVGTKKRWLFSEINPEDYSQIYGLFCDEVGEIREGYFSLDSIESACELEYINNDTTINTENPLSIFKIVAQRVGRIVVDEILYQEYFDNAKLNL